MNAQSQNGYLLIGDITGYTSYVAQTELEHSQEVLTELLELLVRNMTPVTTLSKLEGDAVFAYTPQRQVDRGELLVELIEATYFSFRDRVASIDRATTCTCNACQAIPTLDLKFMLHFGEYFVQSVSGHHELVGSDVNLIHRLTKNQLQDETGWTAYAMLTKRSLQEMGIPSDGMHALVETYDHIGEVSTFSFNLRDRYTDMVENRVAFVTEEEADCTITFEFDLPLSITWEWLSNPEKRNQYFTKSTWSNVARQGRTGTGTTNHCAHGEGQISVETILDWRPLEYYTTDSRARIEERSNQDMLATHEFKSIDDGNRTQYTMRVKFRNLPFFMKFLMPYFYRMQNKQSYARMEELARAEIGESPLSPNIHVLMEAATHDSKTDLP